MKKAPFDFDISQYPELNKYKGVLVLGTDTEVGKTMVSGMIARSLKKQGKTVDVFKPVASGCRKTPAGMIGEDAEFLAAAADTRRPLHDVIPIQLGPALAPNLSARRTGVDINLQTIFDAYNNLAKPADDNSDPAEAVVVEGVGGLLCPITDEYWVIHFAKMLKLPVVVVARPNLGTINHTLLTVDTLRRHDVDILGVIINRYWPDAVPTEVEATDDAIIAMQNNPAEIEKLGDVPVLAIVPDSKNSSVADATISDNTQFAIDTINWAKLLKIS